MRAAQAMQQQTRRVAMEVLVRAAATIHSSWLQAPLRAASLSAGASNYLAAVFLISARAKRARKTDAAECIPSALAAARLPAPMHAQTPEFFTYSQKCCSDNLIPFMSTSQCVDGRLKTDQWVPFQGIQQVGHA